MNQKPIRRWNGQKYSADEGSTLIAELDDRTRSNLTGYNSVNELGARVKSLEQTGSPIEENPNVVENNGVTILTPLDAQMSIDGVKTGAIKIRLPQSWTGTMMKLEVSIYDYLANRSFDVIISGYTDGGNRWYETSCQIIGSVSYVDYTVRFGHDGEKCCIYIGELNTVFIHSKIAVTRGLFGYYRRESSLWLTGWGISLETTSLQNIDRTHTNNLI